MFTKENLHPIFKYVYEANKKSLTDEAFNIWFEYASTLSELPREEWGSVEKPVYPENKLRPKEDSSVATLVASARQAVAGLSSGSATKKAVEALASALEAKENS